MERRKLSPDERASVKFHQRIWNRVWKLEGARRERVQALAEAMNEIVKRVEDALEKAEYETHYEAENAKCDCPYHRAHAKKML